MANADLFRRQALNHAAEKSIAAGVVRQPRWAARWIAPVVFGLLLAGGWLAVQPYTDSIRVQGLMARPGGEVVLRSPVSGLVADFSARPGTWVSRGDRLMVIDDSRYSAANDETANEVVLLQTALATQERQLQLQLEQVGGLQELERKRLAAEQRSLDEDRALLRIELSLAERLLAQAKEAREDAQTLANDGHLARMDVRALERREAQQESELLKLRRTLASVRHQSVGLDQQRRRSSLEAAASSARLRSELARLASEHARLPGRRQAVVAPISGTVRAIRVAPGGGVDRQQPLLTIIDDDAPLVAELPVPSGSVTNVFPGQRVQLRYSGFPHQRYGSFAGTVLDVTAAPTAVVSSSRVPIAAGAVGAQSASLYRVRVVPDSASPIISGQSRELPVGMQVEADLLGDRRPLWMWLLEPILALRGKLQ